ncbi:MAG: beta-carotene ketolase [Hyphomicrobiaceae bacterium TMED74]|nr:beta-carotene ketolase [Filomicrobium sp.]RPG48398.1 MAG: beta-carotene ketolase [Hyphomicrobiaceae bacterium TMED74]
MLAVALIGSWLALHVYCLFFHDFAADSVLVAVLTAALLTWLYVGIFIVAHDCMHGSLAPGRPLVNRVIGQICVFLYAGFSFDALNRKHHLHHRHAGTEADPDFDHHPPHSFFAWYLRFFMQYFTWRELLVIAGMSNIYMHLLAVDVANIVAFWAGPALVSSLQLFTFGTYLPHRPEATAFNDRHRTRSNSYPWWISLLTCFHFGYHHEHHSRPDLPWWRLPAARTNQA